MILFNEKIRTKDGTIQPVRYDNATYEYVGDNLVIKYDGNHDGRKARCTAKIPRNLVAAIVEEEPAND